VAASNSSLPAQKAAALKRLAVKYNSCTQKADELRVQLDAVVQEAKDSGGTFREIATLAERSVAWVQGSLQRSQNRTK
jgi:hypothetical protein